MIARIQSYSDAPWPAYGHAPFHLPGVLSMFMRMRHMHGPGDITVKSLRMANSNGVSGATAG